MHRPAAGETRARTRGPTRARGFTSPLSDYFIIANCRCDQAARKRPAVAAKESISKWSISSPHWCYPGGKRLHVPACWCPSPLQARRSPCRPCAASSLRGCVGTQGSSSHPPTAAHPSILFPNMATSFSFNHPQNCSWDFRNVSFHCVCLITLPGGVAGLRESCSALVMGEWA